MDTAKKRSHKKNKGKSHKKKPSTVVNLPSSNPVRLSVPIIDNLSDGENLSDGPNEVPNLLQFGTPKKNRAGSPLSSISSSDEEFESVAGSILGDEPAAAGAAPGSDLPPIPGAVPEVGADRFVLPVFTESQVETGLRFCHARAVDAKWGEHWNLQDWQRDVMVPALFNYLTQLQASAESYIGTFLTRFAGEHRELCALLIAVLLVYVPNVKKTLTLRASTPAIPPAQSSTAKAGGAGIDGSIMGSAA